MSSSQRRRRVRAAVRNDDHLGAARRGANQRHELIEPGADPRRLIVHRKHHAERCWRLLSARPTPLLAHSRQRPDQHRVQEINIKDGKGAEPECSLK